METARALFAKSRALLPSLGRAGEISQLTPSPVPTGDTPTPPAPHPRPQPGQAATSPFGLLLASHTALGLSKTASVPASGEIILALMLTLILFLFPNLTHVPTPCPMFVFLPHSLAYTLFVAHFWQISSLFCEISSLILSDRNARVDRNRVLETTGREPASGTTAGGNT